MPDDVRKLYQQAIAQLADTDHDGIPDVLQGRVDGANVIGMLYRNYRGARTVSPSRHGGYEWSAYNIPTCVFS